MSEDKITRIQAMERGLLTYHGAVCSDHPEGGGVRFTKSCKCVLCFQETRSAWGKTESEIQVKAGERRREMARRARRRQEVLAQEIESSFNEARYVYCAYKMCFKLVSDHNMSGSSYWRKFWEQAHTTIRSRMLAMGSPVAGFDRYANVKTVSVMPPSVMYNITFVKGD